MTTETPIPLAFGLCFPLSGGSERNPSTRCKSSLTLSDLSFFHFVFSSVVSFRLSVACVGFLNRFRFNVISDRFFFDVVDDCELDDHFYSIISVETIISPWKESVSWESLEFSSAVSLLRWVELVPVKESIPLQNCVRESIACDFKNRNYISNPSFRERGNRIGTD